jgi:uncharacterized protein YuzE
MNLTYDGDADAAYVYLVNSIGPGEVAQTRAAMLDFDRAFITFDFDANGKILGLEILGASRILSEQTLQTARRPRP